MDHLAYTSDGKTGQGPEFQIEVGRECQPGHESIQVGEPLLSVDVPEKSRQTDIDKEYQPCDDPMQAGEPEPSTDALEKSKQVLARQKLLKANVSADIETSESEAAEVMSSASQDSFTTVTAGETSQEWELTPQVQQKLVSLNNFLRNASEGSVRIS